MFAAIKAVATDIAGIIEKCDNITELFPLGLCMGAAPHKWRAAPFAWGNCLYSGIVLFDKILHRFYINHLIDFT